MSKSQAIVFAGNNAILVSLNDQVKKVLNYLHGLIKSGRSLNMIGYGPEMYITAEIESNFRY